jgi:hypothetical protein
MRPGFVAGAFLLGTPGRLAVQERKYVLARQEWDRRDLLFIFDVMQLIRWLHFESRRSEAG